MKIIIIDNYDSFTFNLYQGVLELGASDVQVFRNDKISARELAALKPDRIIMSPGPGHPALDSDFGVCKDIIVQHGLFGCPVLGVCLGHQGIAHHLGGLVVQAPKIMHGKASFIDIIERSPLFDGISQSFEAMRYHSLIASDDRFPSELKVTARDRQQGLIMALEHKRRPIYGVQFHPESIGTPEGKQILKNFIEKC